MLKILFITFTNLLFLPLVGCDCLERVKELQQIAEMRLEYVEKYSHYAGDTWYWTGQCNAYNDIIEALSYQKNFRD